MITEGSREHPVKLNDHFFGPKIVRVNWGGGPIGIIEVIQSPNDNYNLQSVEPASEVLVPFDHSVDPLEGGDSPSYVDGDEILKSFYSGKFVIYDNLTFSPVDHILIDPGGEVSWIERAISSGSFPCQGGLADGINGPLGSYIGDDPCRALGWGTMSPPYPDEFIPLVVAHWRSLGFETRYRIEGGFTQTGFGSGTGSWDIITETKSVSEPVYADTTRRSWLVNFGKARTVKVFQREADVHSLDTIDIPSIVKLTIYRGGHLFVHANGTISNTGGVTLFTGTRSIDGAVTGDIVQFNKSGFI